MNRTIPDKKERNRIGIALILCVVMVIMLTNTIRNISRHERKITYSADSLELLLKRDNYTTFIGECRRNQEASDKVDDRYEEIYALADYYMLSFLDKVYREQGYEKEHESAICRMEEDRKIIRQNTDNLEYIDDVFQVEE